MARPSTTVTRLAATAAVLVALTGCAPEEPTPTATGTPAGGSTCTKESLPTRTAGKLTIGTDDPAYEPWFSGNDPANGEGFESAVAYAIAEKLGYAKEDVVWTRVRFDNAIAPGPKEFDFDINQFSITDARKQAVDFSSPYYKVRQTIIALKSSKIAGATSLADLKDAKLGAQVGTTSYSAITELVQPSSQPQVYNSNDDAKKALQNGQIDGLVVDLPTAFYITAAEITDAKIVGQVPQVGVPELFGLVLDKGSALTGCVSTAVDDLSRAGTLAELEKKWLAQVAGAPELT
ncbi:ABC transporter substrate-binding protein [Polymorphospora sp. NPDC051019]|uniref:ABC transporter substrate-binding protein n=1 Tax=Polymorphospora sp. NPDC051019 TaxID=3155725 RepID=UPI00342E61C1